MLGLWPLRIDQNGRLIKIEAPGIAKNSLNLWEEVPLTALPRATMEVGPERGWDGEKESSRGFCFRFLPQPAW